MRRGAWIFIGLLLLAIALLGAAEFLGLVLGPGFDP